MFTPHPTPPRSCQTEKCQFETEKCQFETEKCQFCGKSDGAEAARSSAVGAEKHVMRCGVLQRFVCGVFAVVILTIIVIVQPGTSRNAFTLQPSRERSECWRPSVRTFTPALLTLYAVSPGGMVIYRRRFPSL